MSVDFLEFGRTSFVGVYLLFGSGLLWYFMKSSKPNINKEDKWFFLYIFFIASYGLGVFIENLSEPLIEDSHISWFSDERIRARTLFKKQKDAKNPETSHFRGRTIASELASQFAISSKSYETTYINPVVQQFCMLVKNPESCKSWKEIEDVVNPIYFLAKNRVYRNRNYFEEMQEIKARSTFSRTIAFVAFLLIFLTSVFCILTANQQKKQSWVFLCIFLLSSCAIGWFGIDAYRRYEREFDIRAFGYFLEMTTFQDVVAK